MRRWLLACIPLACAVTAMTAVAAEKKAPRRPAPQKLEKLECILGNEDRQARIAVEVLGGRVKSFAYYSKWKPRTCSVHHFRDDAYSKWSDEGRFTKVLSEHGDFLIEYQQREVSFIFREVDRMFYCGMEGKINGSVTVRRGRRDCVLDGVMDEQSAQ